MNNRTELVFILDKSGSMGGKESDTIGGFNSVLENQKQEEGTAIITSVLFDNRIELLHDRLDLRAVLPITRKDYFVEGSTALLDAIGFAIQKTLNAQQIIAEEYRANSVLFTIITDGLENASRRYSIEMVRTMIEERKQAGWEFIFLGANIDAVLTAQEMGIDAHRAQNFVADGAGIHSNFASASKAASTLRQTGKIAEDWDQELKDDLKNRQSH